jgi:transaldolase
MMEGEDEIDLGEELEEIEELSSPTAAKPDVPKIEETPNNEGGEEKNIERSEPGSIKNLEDMLNKLLEAVQFTDRRCQAIEKKLEKGLKTDEQNQKVENSIVLVPMKEKTNNFKKKISSIIVLSQSDDFEMALEKIGEEAQTLLKMVNEEDHNEI